jgi:hypothetical protein
MAEIIKIERMAVSNTAFRVTLDQEIWDSFAKIERKMFIVYANDEIEAYNIAMKGIWHEQSRTR